ncbi:MAG: hypothetical protein GXY20_00685 [Clostridiales bacterium]|nr:hypothetical protein [Clostridiales bacterium]
MGAGSGRIYHGRNPLRALLKVLLWIIIIAAALFVFAFFWFKRYIVYTDDGIILDVPFLHSSEPVEQSDMQVTEDAE